MSDAFVNALDQAPNWILECLQKDQDRFALFLYKDEGSDYINTVIGSGESFPLDDSKETNLTWRMLRYVDFEVPTPCYVCQSYQQIGYTFHQAQMIHFLCIGCIQGN